ncbi:hypothetical protein [Photobacterium phage PDCC-1]|uniref:Uncharacterized protein n=1 Tax=Photobacterium phage PDCC-1 TaxID=2664246 RepID=A0A6B9J2C0_9CAUD|nr:hypothetical protein HWC77_gp104 [Photobacterium phage PDCC-1]QGZ14467.1 hypothetical protein [Photobacterium phage PDCC-1]
MSKKNKGTRRGVQIKGRQQRLTKLNQYTIANTVKEISDHFYFFGSHAHQLSTMDWAPKLLKLKQSKDRQVAIKALITLLSEPSPWQLFLFVGVDTGETVEVFSYLQEFKNETHVKIATPCGEFITECLNGVKRNILNEKEYKGTQLKSTHKVCGFGYYLFNSDEYNLDAAEDSIADSLYETGVFDHPFDENDYVTIKPSHFTELFTRQELKTIKG